MYLHLKMSILFSITKPFASHAAIKGEDKRQKGKRVASVQVWAEQEENKNGRWNRKWISRKSTGYTRKSSIQRFCVRKSSYIFQYFPPEFFYSFYLFFQTRKV